MNDKRGIGSRFYGANTVHIQPALAVLLQMHIANRNRHGVDTGLTGKFCCLYGIGAG